FDSLKELFHAILHLSEKESLNPFLAFSITASIRSSTPLSIHEIKIQASDSYGDATQPTSFEVIVAEADEDDLLGDGDGLSITFIAIIVAIGALAAAAFVMLRQRHPPKDGSDRFGFQ
ncbi:MAG: hypothetical protein ACPH17_02260, partial [Candidatus Poseidoniaceae archaeon]